MFAQHPAPQPLGGQNEAAVLTLSLQKAGVKAGGQGHMSEQDQQGLLSFASFLSPFLTQACHMEASLGKLILPCLCRPLSSHALTPTSSLAGRILQHGTNRAGAWPGIS